MNRVDAFLGLLSNLACPHCSYFQPLANLLRTTPNQEDAKDELKFVGCCHCNARIRLRRNRLDFTIFAMVFFSGPLASLGLFLFILDELNTNWPEDAFRVTLLILVWFLSGVSTLFLGARYLNVEEVL